MANRLQKVPAVQFIPGVPGAPAVPAHCYDEPVYSDFGQYAESLQWMSALTEMMTKQKLGRVYYGVVAIDANGNEIYGPKTVSIPPDLTAMFTGAGASAGAVIAGYRRVCYPAIPAVAAIPPRVVYDSLPGWNSGGVSIGGFTGDGYVEFQIGGGSIGAVVGLNSRSDTVSPADCSHAFYGHQGSLDIIEGGAVVFTVPGGLAGDPKLRLGRAGGVVTYMVNGAVVYTSPNPSTGYARLDASLYSAGDYVDNPLIATFGRGTAVGRVGVTAFFDPRARATGRAGVGGVALGRSGAVLYGAAIGDASTSGSATGFSTGYGVALVDIGVSGSALPAPNYSQASGPAAVGLSSDSGYSQAVAAYRGGYQGAAAGGFPEVSISYSVGYAPMPLGFGNCLSGGVATSAGIGPVGGGVSGENGYAQSLGAYSGGYQGFAYAPWLSDDSAIFAEPALVIDEFSISGDALATFVSSVDVGDGVLLDLEIVAGLEWFESILLSSTVAETSDIEAAFLDQIAVTTQSNIPQLEGIQYSTNVQTGAITRYSNFAFLAICQTPYGALGVKEDGIYRIGAGTDDGEPIDLMVDFGAKDFGTTQLKRIESIYFGLCTDGKPLAVLKADDGREVTYQVTARVPTMRVATGKGVVGRSWRLRLKIYEATQAELDSVELSVATSNRRIR